MTNGAAAWSFFIAYALGQFTGNYTQTAKRVAHNKGRYYSGVGGISCPRVCKGLSPGHTTLLAKCSTIRSVGGAVKMSLSPVGQGHWMRQENKELVSSADSTSMKASL